MINNSPSPSANIYESENWQSTIISGNSGIIAALGLGSSTGEIDLPVKERRCNDRSSEDSEGDTGSGFNPGNISCSNSLTEILVSYLFVGEFAVRILPVSYTHLRAHET